MNTHEVRFNRQSAQLSSVHVESCFNCKLLCLSQVGGGAVVFMSSSVPGEVRPATTHPLPGLTAAFVFAFSPRLGQNQMCTATRSTAQNFHYLYEYLLNLDTVGVFLCVSVNYECHIKFGFTSAKKAAMCSWLIQRRGFVLYQRSMCKQHFLIASLCLNKRALQTAAGWDCTPCSVGPTRLLFSSVNHL